MSPEKVAVITACYGGYDDPPGNVPEQDLDASWTYVTDAAPGGQSRGWSFVVEPRPHVHPRIAAKVPKCVPWEYVDADVYVWIDASARLLRRDSLRWIVEQSEGHKLTQFKHPWRDCTYDEVEECIAIPKYERQPLEAQAAHYRSQGHPEHWGLWACGLIAYRPGLDGRVPILGARWLTEILRWSWQDQVSYPPLLRGMKMWPHSLRGDNGKPAPLHGNGHVEWRPHRGSDV